MWRLWNDITVHRTSATVFALWWLAVYAYTLATASGGMPRLAVWLHGVTAIAAGALIAWWRFPVREGLLVGWKPAGAPLAGGLVAIAVVTVVFVRDGVEAALSGVWALTGLVELFAGWFVASAMIGAIGLLCGLIGAAIGGVIAKHFKPHEPGASH